MDVKSANIDIRRAEAAESSLLTELALRSKAHWGYDPQFIEDCRADLTISPDYISTNPVYVAAIESEVAGFYSLLGRGEDCELDFLYVEPGRIGNGCGSRLWRHAVEEARRLGFRRILIQSDPFAETFYRAMGAERVGERESPVRAGRLLPLLRFDLQAGH